MKLWQRVYYFLVCHDLCPCVLGIKAQSPLLVRIGGVICDYLEARVWT